MKNNPKYFNYYDVAPEHNEQMNVNGFRTFLLLIALFFISLILFLLLNMKANERDVNTNDSSNYAVCADTNL